MKNRIVCLLLCICLLAACVPAVSAYSNVSEWAQEAADSMSGLGFLPDSVQNSDLGTAITRGEMCKMTARVYANLIGEVLAPDATPFFSDTTDREISYAGQQSLVSGDGDGTFRPNDYLTRQDMVKIVHNMMLLLRWTISEAELTSLDRFSDASAVSGYAKKSMQALVTIGLIKGDGTVLRPLDNITKEEAVLLLFRAYVYMGDYINTQGEKLRADEIYSQGYTGISPWAISEVLEMKKQKLIPASMDSCDMSKAISRAQMCAIAILAYEKITAKDVVPGSTAHFTDTADPDVNAAYELGIIDGYGGGRFGPGDPLTREQFFKIMTNLLGTLGYPRTDSRAVSLSSYGDGGTVASWAQAPTRLMIYLGVVRGDGKNLKPKANTSIEEAVAVFLRSYKYIATWKAEHPDGEEPEAPTIQDDIVAFARGFVGYPYVYGGNGPSSFDCSGFVLYVYRHFGYSFSRGAQEQYLDGTPVAYGDLQPGDLVFFSSSAPDSSNFRSITHVGLYLGDGYFIHASNPTRGVVIDSLWSGYYSTHFWGACRILKS